MHRPGKIRHYDSQINATARLIDSAIILLTFFALIDLFYVAWKPFYVWILLFAILLFNFFAESQDAYRSWRGASLIEEMGVVLASWFSGIALLILMDALFVESEIYLIPFVTTWILVTPIEIISWHALARVILAIIRSKGHNTRTVAIVGVTPIGKSLQLAFSKMDWSGYQFIGYYDDRGQSRVIEETGGEPVVILGNSEQLLADCRAGKIDGVYITFSLSAEARIKELVDRLSDTTSSVYLVPDFFTFKLLSSRWVDYQGITAVSIYDTPFRGLDSFVKRLEDIILSIMALLIALVPMLLIALIIRLTSKGPIFFKQNRYGIDGEKIRVWKFRSMTVAENGANVTQAIKGDHRITPFGALLRKTSLDELPQFLNVLTGHMSVVGPRPHAVAHNEEYREKIEGYMLRHKVKPGITGLAQINGFRGETDALHKMEGRVFYDLQYIQSWSLWLDLKIVLLTLLKGFNDKNAY